MLLSSASYRHPVGRGSGAHAAARAIVPKREPFEGAVGKAREFRYADIRDALESALEGYLFASAGEAADRACPACADGQLMLKIGRFGPFVACVEFPAVTAVRSRATLRSARGPAGRSSSTPTPRPHSPSR